MHKYSLILLLGVILVVACTNETQKDGQYVDLGLKWAEIDSINQELPAGIKVFHTEFNGESIRAWYVKVEEYLPTVESRVVVSIDSDRRETISDFAKRLNADVMINGGYFRMDLNPAKHVGILKVDGEVVQPATPSVLRGEQRYYLHRSAIGFNAEDEMAIGWVSSQSDSVFLWDQGINNMPDAPGARLDSSHRELWDARDVLGGGPLLIRDGRINIAINEEAFFGTSIPQVHPRTAAGISEAGDLILLLVDGRQLVSRGVDLNELASILMDLGCQDALNLDGGGSSALVVNGQLLNRPAGKTTEREVMSAIAVFSQ